MTLFTLHARLNHPDAGEVGKTCYHYDDVKHGVYAEQLVESVTETIHQVLLCAQAWSDIKAPPEFVTLRFTADVRTCLMLQAPANITQPIVKLIHREHDNGFDVYDIEGVYPQDTADEIDFIVNMNGLQCDLCPHLLDYFGSAPDVFYCQVSLTQSNTAAAA